MTLVLAPVGALARTRFAFAFGAVLFALSYPLAFTASASAAPTWLAPQTIADSPAAPFGTEVAADPEGNAVAVWSRYDRNGTPTDSSDDRYVVEAAFRPAGAAFGSPEIISPSNAATERHALYPHVGIDDDGNAFAMWTQCNSSFADCFVRGRSRTLAGGWGSTQELSVPETGRSVRYWATRLAVSDSGKLVAVWSRYNGSADVMQAQTGSVGASFGFPVTLPGTTTGATDPSVAIDPSGNVVVTWSRHNGTNAAIETSTKAASGGFGGPQVLSPVLSGRSASNSEVALDPVGRATVVYQYFDNNGTTDSSDDKRSVNFTTRTVSSSTGFAGGAWQPVGAVNDTGDSTVTSAFNPAVVVDENNTAVAVYTALKGGSYYVQSAHRPSNSSFRDHLNISSPGSGAFIPRIDMNRAGAAIATWARFLSSGSSIQASRRPHGGTWGDVDNVDTPTPPDGGSAYIGDHPTISVDGEGNAISAWSFAIWNGTAWAYPIRYAGFDAAPPRLNSVTVPANAVAKQPVEMSASISDAWSAFSTTWEFGDGSSATGASVNHSYANAGTYTVKLTATDAVGNAASATRTIQISTPPAQPSPAPAPDPSPAPAPAPAPEPSPEPSFPPAPSPRPADEAKVEATIKNAWKATKRYTTVKKLVVQGIPKGATLAVSCKKKKGKSGCPFKAKQLKVVDGGTRNLTKLFAPLRKQNGKRKRMPAKLKPKTIVEIKVTLPNHIGQVLRLKIRKKRIPAKKVLCTTVNSRVPTAC